MYKERVLFALLSQFQSHKLLESTHKISFTLNTKRAPNKKAKTTNEKKNKKCCKKNKMICAIFRNVYINRKVIIKAIRTGG